MTVDTTAEGCKVAPRPARPASSAFDSNSLLPSAPIPSTVWPPRSSCQGGSGIASRTTAHSASVISNGWPGRLSGWLPAFPNRCARQSHDQVAELDPAAANAYNGGNRASCVLVGSTTPSYTGNLAVIPEPRDHPAELRQRGHARVRPDTLRHRDFPRGLFHGHRPAPSPDRISVITSNQNPVSNHAGQAPYERATPIFEWHGADL